MHSEVQQQVTSPKKLSKIRKRRNIENTTARVEEVWDQAVCWEVEACLEEEQRVCWEVEVYLEGAWQVEVWRLPDDEGGNTMIGVLEREGEGGAQRAVVAVVVLRIRARVIVIRGRDGDIGRGDIEGVEVEVEGIGQPT